MSSAGCVDEDAGVLATGLAAHFQTWMRAIACRDEAFCQGLPHKMPPRKKRGLSTLVAVGDLGTSQPWKETGDAQGRCPIPQQAGEGKLLKKGSCVQRRDRASCQFDRVWDDL